MNQTQTPNEKNEQIKPTPQVSTNFNCKNNLKEKSGGVFDDLINAMKQKDQNLKKTQDIFIKFCNQWEFTNHTYNRKWQEDLFELYQKETKQKQKEIRDCVFDYVMLTKKLEDRFALKFVFYQELDSYLIKKYIQSAEYQFHNRRSFEMAMQMSKKNIQKKKKEQQIKRSLNGSKEASLLSYFSQKWVLIKNIWSQNQVSKEEEAVSFLSQSHNHYD